VNIVDEVFEEMEIDDLIEEIEEIGNESDESDDDHVLSTDSDCISDCSDDLTEISRKVVTNSQLNALNGGNIVPYISIILRVMLWQCARHV